MRRLIVAAAVLLLVGGCKKRDPIQTEPTDESLASFQSVVATKDPKGAIQLLKGFHQIEHEAWRWTESRFAASLKTPAGAAEKGAKLVMKFAAPEPVFQKHSSQTVTAFVNGTAVGSEKFNATGQFVFQKEIPVSLIKGDATTVEFTVDNFLPAGAADLRELALIVSSIGLESR